MHLCKHNKNEHEIANLSKLRTACDRLYSYIWPCMGILALHVVLINMEHIYSVYNWEGISELFHASGTINLTKRLLNGCEIIFAITVRTTEMFFSLFVGQPTYFILVYSFEKSLKYYFLEDTANN